MRVRGLWSGTRNRPQRSQLALPWLLLLLSETVQNVLGLAAAALLWQLLGWLVTKGGPKAGAALYHHVLYDIVLW